MVKERGDPLRLQQGEVSLPLVVLNILHTFDLLHFNYLREELPQQSQIRCGLHQIIRIGPKHYSNTGVNK